MARGFEIFLNFVLLVLLLTNVRILLMGRDEWPSCSNQKIHSVKCERDRFSVLTPAKCASVLRGVDSSRGLVLGKRREKKVLLTLGIAVWDDHVDYFQQIVSSLTKHVTAEDSRDVAVVISASRNNSAKLINLLKEKFSYEVSSGLVHLVSPPRDYIKAFAKAHPLGNVHLKEFSKTFSDKMIAFNKNLGFLLYYAVHLSEYTLHLSSDSMASRRFLPDIKYYIERYKNSTYHALIFSNMWLMPSSVLHSLNEFYTMFGYYSTPSILNEYRTVRKSRDMMIDTKSDLFSSVMTIDCKRPKASLQTNLVVVDAEHDVHSLYSSDGNRAFWAGNPKKGDFIEISFDDLIKISRVVIIAGSPYFVDTPKKASLKACAMNDDRLSCDISNCYTIATMGDPLQDIAGLENVIGFDVKCLRLEFVAKADTWVMIREIAVWTQ